MHELECLGVFVFQDDPCLTRMLHLTEKRAEFDTSFMIYESLGEKPAAVTSFENSGTQVDVLAITHGSEAAQGFISTFLNAQIEAAWVELVHLLFASTDAARGEEGGHRVIDGLLYGRERRVGAVGTPESIARLAVKFGLYGLQIVFRHDDIRVQNDEVLASAVFGPIVARRPWTRVGLEVVAQSESALVFLTDVIAFLRRAVLHHNDLKIFERLMAKALQQLIDFLWPVVDGYDDRKPHFHYFLQR